MIILVLHLTLELYRWQMVPLYILFAILLTIWLLPTGDRSWLGWVGVSILSLLTIVFLAPPILFPIRNFPEPTGSYAVGTLTEAWIDDSRKEIYGDNSEAAREFITQTWYPADTVPATAQRSEYIPTGRTAARTIAARLGLPFFILDHVNLIKTNSFVEVPPAAGEFPILIFSHGYNSFRGQSTAIMEDLASHGYIVVSMSHPYGSAISIFPDGRIVFHNPDTLVGVGEELRQTGLLLGEQWTRDIEFTIDQLERNQVATSHLLSQHYQLDQLGVFGHSTGGGVALNICARDPRCKATFGFDAWLGPTPDDVISKGSPAPTYFLMSEFWPKTINTNRIREYDKNSAVSTWATVKNTGHYDFADIPFLSPLTKRFGFSGGIDPYRGQEINRLFVLDFFDTHLKEGEPASFLYSADPNFPEIELGVPDDVSANDE